VRTWRLFILMGTTVVGVAGLMLLIGLVVSPTAAQHPITGHQILIESVLFDGYALNDMDEAVRLLNIGIAPVPLKDWSLSDGSTTVAVIEEDLTLAPGQGVWLTRDKASFRASFGEEANYQPDRWPGFANGGDEVLLIDAAAQFVDVLVYLGGEVNSPGWSGLAVSPYKVAGVFAGEGQLLYRRRDPATGMPVTDTDSAADWAQMTADAINGRKVRYPGWQLDKYYLPALITATSTLTIAVAPDNAYETLRDAIDGAKTSIDLASLTLENIRLGEALAAAARRGVVVNVLLEGGPPGGLSDQERYVCRQLESAGGACWFMINDAARRIYDRYSYMHAKYMIIDGHTAVISSENFSPNSMPFDDKTDGTWGRRGVVLLTDAQEVVDHLATIFADDLNIGHADIFRWSAEDLTYGAPPAGYMPLLDSGGVTYTVRYPEPIILQGTFAFEWVQAPENALREHSGLLGLINRAGAGDRLLVQELAERPYWGATTSNPADDPNPRLEALIAAARRGANVRLQLDSFFDDPSSKVSNAATCLYVNAIAYHQALAMRCGLGNPSGLGIHNKMVLAWVNGRGYVHIGSLNGTELSSKGNREIAVQVQSDEAFAYLARMFEGDLGPTVYMPVALANFRGAAAHMLISEIVYDTPGPDEAEYIELVNPTGVPVNLDGYALGDAVYPTDFEDRRLFPRGIIIMPGQTLVITLSAMAFRAEFGVNPDLEIVDTDSDVPNMIDDPTWGDPKALLQLGNSGDEVMLWQGSELVDVVTYGSGSHPSVVSCPLLVPPDRSLFRSPYWVDTDDCPVDFRSSPFPSPGRLP
jgi:phosphatidylserine/phosphatidylglycerophosphate/cardiolipin synthase-like enzyme